MSTDYSATLERLLNGRHLAEDEAAELMRDLAAGDIDAALAGALLAGLRAKGETADEIRGLANAMRDLALDPGVPAGTPMVETVGTGGDGSGSYNLSTGSGLLAAAAGATVVKHGNRSVSSKSGSADMLQALGMPIPLEPSAALEALDALNFTFLFAPAYHPAMKQIMPVRIAMGVRTVFNILGPLANPAGPSRLVVGAFSVDMARLMAGALAGMPIERAFVIHGEPGWDEATPVGEFVLFDVTPGQVSETTRTPEDYGVARCEPGDLKGGDSAENAAAFERVVRGEEQGPHRDALLMGTSLVLEVSGQADDRTAGVEQARDAIDSGRAGAFLDDLKAHFAGA
jgi:anthranilate phosphoribosyltransferase